MLRSNRVRVRIEDLRVNAYLGAHAHEQKKRSRVTVDLEFEYEPPSADALALAIDYRDARDKVLAAVESRRFCLVESMARTIADAMKDDSRMSSVVVKVSKPKALRQAKAVSAVIKWIRSE